MEWVRARYALPERAPNGARKTPQQMERGLPACRSRTCVTVDAVPSGGAVNCASGPHDPGQLAIRMMEAVTDAFRVLEATCLLAHDRG